MATEGVTLDFTDDAIDAIADIAVEVNANVENIGARRLQTVMERVLDEVSFTAPDRAGETVEIDAAYVASTSAISPATPTCPGLFSRARPSGGAGAVHRGRPPRRGPDRPSRTRARARATPARRARAAPAAATPRARQLPLCR